MSLTWNSSKHSRAASAAMASASGGTGVGDAGVLTLVGEQPGVHVLHELVEVDAALVGDFGLVEEQVHQHGLAAPDRPHEVEAIWPGRRLIHRASPKQAADEATLLVLRERIVAAQLGPQIL